MSINIELVFKFFQYNTMINRIKSLSKIKVYSKALAKSKYTKQLPYFSPKITVGISINLCPFKKMHGKLYKTVESTVKCSALYAISRGLLNQSIMLWEKWAQK